ncbi:prolyl oligopeptidase family serine peptidase [Arthrobacter sp. fls2-241-R2A-200]|uniref:alpha/beta hydrolase family protein n=2 Tax=Bacillati TaxID=1783272 RepID=UPI00254CAA9D|nr:prolyl oligopeptidase family serine peptidase [Arthrobacter sp. fls2-241-R2A-200]
MGASFTAAEATWNLDGIAMRGTLLRPAGSGPFPAVVLVAGSGPTDRDWRSPLLPGANGSGRLLAEAFAEAGIASLRYDKRVSGPHGLENAAALIGRLSMQSHLDELVAAVQVLAAEEFVDSSRIAGLGSSEGALHILHYVTSPQAIPFAGIVLAAPPGRSGREVLLSQLALMAAQVPNGDELFALVRAAATRYEAGQPMDLDPRLPENVRMVLSSFEAPANLPLARELWMENAADSLSAVKVPTLALIGGRDLQIDQHADGDPLRAAATGMANVTFAFPQNANHVFKEDHRSPAEVASTPGNGYNDENTHLDPESLQITLRWLSDLFLR